MLSQDSLWELNVELNNEVSLWLIYLFSKLCCGVDDDVTCLSDWHALSSNSNLSLWTYHFLWSYKDLAVVQSFD